MTTTNPQSPRPPDVPHGRAGGRVVAGCPCAEALMRAVVGACQRDKGERTGAEVSGEPQTLVCEACARDGLPSGAHTILRARTLDAMLDDVLRVGELMGEPHAGTRAAVALRERAFRACEHLNPFDDLLGVIVLEGVEPPTIAGGWSPQWVERAGGRCLLNASEALAGNGSAIGPQAGARTTPGAMVVSLDDLSRVMPQRVVVLVDALDEATVATVRTSLAGLAWRGVPCAIVPRHSVGRATPQMVDALAWLAAWLHERPELIPPGFAWREVRLLGKN